MTPSKAAATLGVLTIMLSGCAATPPVGHATAVPSPVTASAPAPSPTPSVDPASITTLGPDGAGPIELGMTKTQVAATGAVTGLSGTEGTCGQPGDGRLVGALPADDSDFVGQLFFSTSTGKLVVIAATPAVATPEGIHLGSSLTEVNKAYPSWKGDEGGDQGADLVDVDGNEKAAYRVYVDAGQVLELSLQLRRQDCS
ncbi:MAG TPA: hypothetical protein PKD84_01605 [Propionicimonas sp.]|nr:hypothetical protein [Propionicimonas sp.]